jgi:hypothetical protein
LVRELLINHYGADAPFLQQVQDGVEGFVHRCIEQLNSPGPTGNALPIQQGTDYRMPARTAQQLRQDVAADERAVKPAPGKRSSLVVNEDVTEEELEKRGEIASPVAPPKEKKLILPASVRAPAKKKPDGWAL